MNDVDFHLKTHILDELCKSTIPKIKKRIREIMTKVKSETLLPLIPFAVYIFGRECNEKGF
ncbi:hypothetical protein RCH13_001198 [Chryseobacterium sp. MP_3.2]|nr:hypothetical protein [Chryseobacterium sp. MP_3.2]